MSEVICSSREGSLPALQKLKNTLMWKCHIQNHIAKKTLKHILARTDLWRQKFKIACRWRECHDGGMSILQFLTGHLPLVLCTLREASRLLNAEKSLPIGYELDL